MLSKFFLDIDRNDAGDNFELIACFPYCEVAGSYNSSNYPESVYELSKS